MFWVRADSVDSSEIPKEGENYVQCAQPLLAIPWPCYVDVRRQAETHCWATRPQFV